MVVRIDFRKILFFYLALASVEFFKIIGLPPKVSLLLKFSGVILMFAIIALDYTYFRKEKIKHTFNPILGLFFLSIVTSTLSAYIFHNQGFFLTIWAQHTIFYYLFYYFLHIMKFKPEELNRLLLAMGFIYLGGYLLQYMIFPKMIFDFRMEESRGTIRIFIYGSAFLGYAYFYQINKFFITNNLKNAVFALALFLFYILNGTRSSLFIIVFITILGLILSKKVKSKLLIIVLFGIAGFFFFLIFQDIITAMIELSNNQINEDDENIRLRATRFFLTTFQPNFMTYIMGNGIGHQTAQYGLQILSYKIVFGFYQSDIGLVGEYSIYGAFFVIGAIAMIFSIFFTKFPIEYRFIRYFMADLLLSITTGMVFSIPYCIIIMLSICYFIDYFKYHKSLDSEDNIINNRIHEPGNLNTGFQQP